MMELSDTEIQRYARHLLLPEVGAAGQQRLRAARVLCVGAGGLGSPAAMYLAAAGVGRLGIVDHDVVELSNLQRQVLHGTADVGRPKTESARAAVQRLNPHVEVVTHATRLTAANAREIFAGYDVVVDGTDNFPTRYLVNDACVLLGKPNVYGSVFRWEGQASLFAPHLGGPCYRCLFPEPPPPGTAPSCAEAGVLGVLPGIIGCIQATEALKLVLGQGQSLLGRLLLLDALDMRFKELRLRQDPACPACGEHPSLTRLTDLEPVCPPSTEDRLPGLAPDEVSVQDMQRALDLPELGITVIDVREPPEWAIASVAGTRRISLSRLAERLAELDPNRPYYLHCQAGVRSLRAVELLRARGFRDVRSVHGGLQAWMAEGHRVRRDVNMRD
jgi:adenylyltransferase/sulfurtransferase